MDWGSLIQRLVSLEEEEGHVKAANSCSFISSPAQAKGSSSRSQPPRASPPVQGALWPIQYPQTILKVIPDFHDLDLLRSLLLSR